MDWYDKLTEYFPEHELKDKGQMEALLVHHDAYRKRETDEYLVTYAEFPTFIFIDYLIVKPGTRGKGIGGKVLDQFKRQGKMMILEVEPPDAEDADSAKRIRFYERNGFQKADHIEYTRSDEDGAPHTMDIYYYIPDAQPTARAHTKENEETVLRQMATVCREIHNFRALKYYGRLVADPEDVLNWLH